MALLLVGAVGSSAASASSSVLYLSGGGVPVAQLSGSAPGGGPLPNYDPGRDSFPGLLLKESDEFAYEDDPTKYQAWIVSGGMTLAGNVSLTFWSAMKDFKTNKEGGVDAFLFDCNSGGSCNLLGEGYANVDPWNPG